MESFNNPFEPLNLLVVVRKVPRLVKPAWDAPKHVLRVPASNAMGSVVSSHVLLFEAKSPYYGHLDAGRPPTQALIRGLERALVPYYPLAGRLRPAAHVDMGMGADDRIGHHGPHLDLHCFGQGAVFVEAQANISLGELKKLDKLYWSDLHYDYVPESANEIPALVVQVTTLTCGGFVVCIKVLHSLLDAAGILHFLHAWSQMTREDKQAFISAKPIWGGKIPLEGIGYDEPHKLHFPSLDMMTMFEDEEGEEYLQDMNLLKVSHQQQHLLGLSNISIPILHLMNLKDTIQVNCNKFEALAALFWRERTKALDLPPAMDSYMFFPAPLPHDVHLAFYGQYGFNCMVKARVGNLVQWDLTDLVMLIHEAKSRLHDNFLQCVRTFARLHAPPKRSAPPNVLLFTLLSNELFSTLDFGWATAPALTPDAVRMHSPINIVAITGGLEDTIELVLTNCPPSVHDQVHQYLLPTHHYEKSRL